MREPMRASSPLRGSLHRACVRHADINRRRTRARVGFDSVRGNGARSYTCTLCRVVSDDECAYFTIEYYAPKSLNNNAVAAVRRAAAAESAQTSGVS